MKVCDIAKKNGFDVTRLTRYIKQAGFALDEGMLNDRVSDSDVDAIVEGYQKKIEDEVREEMRLRKAEEEERERMEKALSSMLVTSGFNFDGYTIKKYSGYISGDDVIQIDRGTHGLFSDPTNAGASLSKALVSIRRNALRELKEAAYELGCNAVIGVDFDYITLEPETANSGGGTTYLPYVFCVTANGNAVVIEKNQTL